MILLILASGSGKRLKQKTKQNPKCLTNINGKPILEYLRGFMNLFNKKIIVVGYKSNKIKKFLKGTKIKFITNKNYNNTNMVESIFCASNHINEDVVIVYSDIIFDKSIFKLLKKKITTMPVKSNWLEIWKRRMNKSEIKKDAENIKINKKFLVNIGGKITNKLPKYQFMGILKIIKEDFKIMRKLYLKINNKNIDLTIFINLYIKRTKKKIFCPSTNKFWLEIDTIKDLKKSTNILGLKKKW